MANYLSIVRLRPEVRDFIRKRPWVNRGEVVVYAPNTRCDGFSTDGAGFRHSTFRGETLSVQDCLQRERYGLVLGSSNLYGFGVAGNENTIPSVLGQRFEFPFANICLPEASSRNLFGLLFAFVARAPKPPSIVIHMSGGDFTGFCYTSFADPVFGFPNLNQMKMAVKEREGPGNPDNYIQPLIAFTSLWTRSIAQLCRARKIPLVLGNDMTFFEKRQPSAIEMESGLGVTSNPTQQRQFETHQKFFKVFCDRRKSLAQTLELPLAGPDNTNDIGFIDEFHYDRDGTRALADDFAAAIRQLI